jgi:hypothetical protein
MFVPRRGSSKFIGLGRDCFNSATNKRWQVESRQSHDQVYVGKLGVEAEIDGIIASPHEIKIWAEFGTKSK